MARANGGGHGGAAAADVDGGTVGPVEHEDDRGVAGQTTHRLCGQVGAVLQVAAPGTGPVAIPLGRVGESVGVDVDDDLVAAGAFGRVEAAGQHRFGHGHQGVGLGGRPSVPGRGPFLARVAALGAQGVRSLRQGGHEKRTALGR